MSYFGLGFAILVIPILAHAGAFSFISSVFPHAHASTDQKVLADSDSAASLPEATLNVIGDTKSATDTSTTEDGALISNNAPGGISENQNDTQISDHISVYTVESGDTLSSIAAQFHVSVNTIRWNNDITGSTIKPGQKLTILPISGIRHTVKSGDTLSSIANLYKAKESDIESYNNITDADVLHVGDIVIVPNGEMTVNSDASPASPPSTPSTVTKAIGSSNPSTANSVPPSPPSASNSLTRVRIGGAKVTLPQGYFIRPVSGPKTQGIHGYNAVDLGDPTGTPIKAAAAGKVIVSLTGGWNGGYGTYVVIEHPNGVETLYAHMSKNVAVENSEVTQGQIIGYVGETGEATGPHLHFEVRGAVNPFGP